MSDSVWYQLCLYKCRWVSCKDSYFRLIHLPGFCNRLSSTLLSDTDWLASVFCWDTIKERPSWKLSILSWIVVCFGRLVFLGTSLFKSVILAFSSGGLDNIIGRNYTSQYIGFYLIWSDRPVVFVFWFENGLNSPTDEDEVEDVFMREVTQSHRRDSSLQ